MREALARSSVQHSRRWSTPPGLISCHVHGWDVAVEVIAVGSDCTLFEGRRYLLCWQLSSTRNKLRSRRVAISPHRYSFICMTACVLRQPSLCASGTKLRMIGIYRDLPTRASTFTEGAKLGGGVVLLRATIST
jgi:hypothetical protein